MTNPETRDDCAQAGATTEHHDALKPFVGTFNAEVRMWMGPGDPHTMKGTMVNEWILGGRFLEQRFVGEPDEESPFGAFEGRGFWGYNTATDKYEGVWIDNASTMMQFEQGHREGDGNIWTMVGEITNPQTGHPMSRRSVTTLRDEDHHTMEMFVTGADGNEHKTMEITYDRA